VSVTLSIAIGLTAPVQTNQVPGNFRIGILRNGGVEKNYVGPNPSTVFAGIDAGLVTLFAELQAEGGGQIGQTYEENYTVPAGPPEAPTVMTPGGFTVTVS
jgi:hypothetical protein